MNLENRSRFHAKAKRPPISCPDYWGGTPIPNEPRHETNEPVRVETVPPYSPCRGKMQCSLFTQKCKMRCSRQGISPEGPLLPHSDARVNPARFLITEDGMNRFGITHHMGYVSPVFDVARSVLAVAIQNGQAGACEDISLATVDPFLRAQELKNLGVNVVVCGAISRPYEYALSAKGIRVIGSVCGRVEEVLSALLNGTLDDERFLTPGSTRPQRTIRRRCGRGRITKKQKKEQEGNGC